MKFRIFENQSHLYTVPLDEASKAAIEIGRAQLRRGEGIPADQVKINVRNRIEALRKAQEI